MSKNIKSFLMVCFCVLLALNATLAIINEMHKTPPTKHEFLCVKVHDIKSRHNVVLECVEVGNYATKP